jgi:hypothetical protein
VRVTQLTHSDTKLVELVQAGDVAGVVRELAALTPAQRRAGAAELTAGGGRVPRRELTPDVKAALFAAELGCQVTPEAATAWLLTYRYFKLGTWTVDVLNLRTVAWQTELVARLGERATASDTVYTLTEHLVHTTGCPPPTSQKFVLAWLFNRANNRQRPARMLGGAPGADLLERLRSDPFTPKLVPPAVARPGHLVFDRPAWLLEALLAVTAEGVADRAELIHNLFADMADDPPEEAQAVAVLEALALTPAEHARVAPERAVLVEHLLGRLRDEGTRIETAPLLEPARLSETAPHLAFLRALKPTPPEQALRVRDYLALLDGSSPVAAYAREVLAGLAEAGLPEPGTHAEDGPAHGGRDRRSDDRQVPFLTTGPPSRRAPNRTPNPTPNPAHAPRPAPAPARTRWAGR